MKKGFNVKNLTNVYNESDEATRGQLQMSVELLYKKGFLTE
jgi:hypothetical protein